jgi:hypothetical protein
VALERLGHRNLAEIESAVARYSIYCAFECTGEINFATEPYQIADLREAARRAGELGIELSCLDRDEVCGEVDSPGLLAGVWDRTGAATCG